MEIDPKITFLFLVVAVGYSTIYSLYSLGQPVNTVAYTGVYGWDNTAMECDGMFDFRAAGSILFWYLPASVLVTATFDLPRIVPLVIAPIAVFYANVVTADCPTNRLLSFQNLAQSVGSAWNSTNFFIPVAVDRQWESTILYSTFAALFIVIGPPPRIRSARLVFFFRAVGAIMFAAIDPTINKLFDEPMSRMCRRGNQNPDRVFDTKDTYFGPAGGSHLLLLAIAVAVLTVVAALLRGRLSQIVSGLSHIISAVLLCQLLYVQRNPGCMNGIEAATSAVGRTGITFIAIAWLVAPFIDRRQEPDIDCAVVRLMGQT